MTKQFLQHEPANARAGIDGGKDEERLEHDGEVVPEAHQPAAEGGAEHLCNADRQGGRATGAREQRLFAHRRGECMEVGW